MDKFFALPFAKRPIFKANLEINKLRRCSLMFIVMILLIGCTRENAAIRSLEDFIPHTVDAPKVQNGILTFNSIDHLKSYYEGVKHMAMERDVVKYPDVDDFLDSLESAMRFRSCRTSNVWRTIGTREDDEEEVEDDWLLDEFRKVCLNENYEVLVDDHIYVYYSENQIFRFLASDIDQLQKLRTTEKGDDTTTPTDKLNPDTKLISYDRNWGRMERTRGGGSSQYTNCVYSLDPVIQSFACNSKKKKFTLSHLVQYSIPSISASFTGVPVLDTHWSIDYGDGSAVEFYEGWNIVLIHEFPNFESYTVTVGFDNVCEDGQQSDSDAYSLTVPVNQENCFGGNMSVIAHDEDVGKRVTSELWVKHDIFGEHQVATTKSYEWRAGAFGGNYRWRRANAYVLAEVNWSFRDSLCRPISPGILSVQTTGLETDHCSNCQSKRAGKTYSRSNGNDNVFFGDDEVTSFHKLQTGNVVIITRSQKLSICN